MINKPEYAYGLLASPFVCTGIFCCFFLGGCFDEPNGVYCVTDRDCASLDCYGGVCIGDPTEDDAKEDKSRTAQNSKADFLFVVDSSHSLNAVQGVMSAGIFTLINELKQKKTTDAAKDKLDVRVAVTNSDMGISYLKEETTISIMNDATCRGVGNNGRMATSYGSSVVGTPVISIQGQVIECQNDNIGCPGDWECALMDQERNGVCTPVHSRVSCPNIDSFLAGNPFLSSKSSFDASADFTDFLTAAACLTTVGAEDCWMAQPFHATVAALTQHGQESFLREDAITVILIISTENDCSLGTVESIEKFENSPPSSYCGDENSLVSPATIKERIVAAKSDAMGKDAADTIIFAAFTDVPQVPQCQGAGDHLNRCLDVLLPYGGRVPSPNIVDAQGEDGEMGDHSEWACEQRNESANVITHAHGANRLVELARLFGEDGFLYSICNEDWTPAMKQIARRVVAKSEYERSAHSE